MENREQYIKLYSLYKELLSESEKKYFEYYYYEDYSYTEISELMEVSKVFVGKMINKCNKKLISFESKLKLLQKKNELLELSNTIKDEKIKSKLQELL